MDNLQEYVRNNFDGIFAVGDIHGDYDSFKRAYDYAVGENFFFISLGDLVDRGPAPFEVVKAMHDIVYEGRGAFIVGNHDDKFYRYAKGAKVSFSVDAKQTLSDVGDDRCSEFLEMYVKIIDTPIFSGLFHTFDDITLVHAAAHPAIWENKGIISKTEHSRYIVGETNGDKDPLGYPVRLYNWVEDIPVGKTVIVGHDRTPISYDAVITEPIFKSGKNGGKAIFMDTGCGKGGFLSGVTIMTNKKRAFNVISYKTI